MNLKSGQLSLLLFCSINLLAQSKQKKLDNYFSALKNNDQFNGNVLVAENNKVIYERSIGYADFNARILNNANTAFPLASVSKTITATAVFLLAGKGLLNFSDPVTKYLPAFPYPGIKIRHLLSHTSGLPPYNVYFDSLRKAEPDRVLSNADFMNGLLISAHSLIYTPGEKGNYDNINYIVLALIIEKVSGMTFQRFIEKNILQPAGMNHTKFYPLNHQYTDRNGEFAVPYVVPAYYSDSPVKAKDVPYIVDYWKGYGFSGFSDYISTTYDLLRYDELYYSNKWVKKEILDLAYTPVRLNNGKPNPANFGLGWEIEIDSAFGKIVYHGGNATGLSCILMRNISKHQTIIVFDNIHNNNSHQIALDVLKIINGTEIVSPRKSIAKIYGHEILEKGAVIARDDLLSFKKDSLHYYLSEDEMNLLGYAFLGGPNNPNPYHFPETPKYAEAIETFKLNMELFPDSWNVYDSYGEALLAVGRKEEAINMYQKSVTLNPENEGGKKILKTLLK
jgi:CubicO group peptidase (beta-lactamase class C family)